MQHREREYGPRSSNESAHAVLADIATGHLALPPWQRNNVWSLEQQHRMLDSMAHQLPMGPIIVWRPPYAPLDLSEATPLCHKSPADDRFPRRR